ncbi:hypothetical protein AVEN_24830-1 [Araneus ventricosus]|uniref:Uncharacterized protein n=1 Tax=Araneus ventricosus TaxID=182803 RepID=A0A4Y2BVM7_ARAVE|nr:hypothetical protein AVEN_24830-1 [Araneus ventricosus]
MSSRNTSTGEIACQLEVTLVKGERSHGRSSRKSNIGGTGESRGERKLTQTIIALSVRNENSFSSEDTMVCDRYNVSDRAAVAITSAVLQDFDIISEVDTFHVVDKNKVRRERSLKRSEIQLHRNEKWHTARGDSIAIFFDGLKDKTLLQTKEGNKFYRKEIVEEHLSFVKEPGSEYFDHITPISGSALCISTNIINCWMKKKDNAKNITAVGCYGTIVNTGHKSDIIVLLEEEF